VSRSSPFDDPRVLRDFMPNDLATWPAPCKAYPPGLPLVELPRRWPAPAVPATAVLAGRPAAEPGSLDLPALARLLHLSAGVVRVAERGFRHIYWDAGTMLSQALALALADSAGLRPRLWTRFPDAELARLVGADGVHEFPVALVGLGGGEPAIDPGGEAATGAVAAAPVEFPLVTLVQRAGDADALGAPWPPGAPLAGEPPASAGLDDVILQRGSTRRMDPTATVPRDVFDFSLAASLGGATVPHFVAVHAVDGLEPGLDRWPDVEHPLRRGPLREQLLRVCWDQHLGRDAAFVVLAAVDPGALDDRGYRDAQLGAGIVEGRLHLAAYAIGIGASGMTFLDSEIAGLLGEPLAGLLFTCVGVPAYRNKAGGGAGEPTPIVIPPADVTPPAEARPRA
jgi:hypothetical protein